MKENDRLPVSEVAEVLGVSEKTVGRLIEGRKLRAYRPSPRKTYVLRKDLAAYQKAAWTMQAA